MELQVGVKALLKNKEGKYLLVKRSSEKYPDIKGEWDIVGGRIQPGSTLFDNLKREIREETKLNLEREPKLIASQDILQTEGRHVVRLTYLGEIEGQPRLNDENVEFKWLSGKELKSLKNLDIYLRELLDQGHLLKED